MDRQTTDRQSGAGAAAVCREAGWSASEPSTSAVAEGKLDVLVSFASRGTMDLLFDRVIIHIFVRDEKTNKAVEGAHVEMTYRGAVVATAETGANGTLELPVSVPKPKGRVMVEVQVTATKAGYAAAQSGAGGPFDFNTKSTSISYQVAVKGDTTGIGVIEGAVSVEPTTGKKAVAVEAGKFATVRTGHPEVVIEQLGPDTKPALEDPAPLVAKSAGAAGEPAAAKRFTIQAGRREVWLGAVVDVPIWIIGATDLANINVIATFDAAVAAIDTAKPDPVRPGSFVAQALFQANPKQVGVVKIGLARTTGSNGTGTLAVIRFAATGKPGEHSSVHLEVTTINDPSGTPLTIDRLDCLVPRPRC